jgi:hypothetical protein
VTRACKRCTLYFQQMAAESCTNEYSLSNAAHEYFVEVLERVCEKQNEVIYCQSLSLLSIRPFTALFRFLSYDPLALTLSILPSPPSQPITLLRGMGFSNLREALYYLNNSIRPWVHSSPSKHLSLFELSIEISISQSAICNFCSKKLSEGFMCLASPRPLYSSL